MLNLFITDESLHDAATRLSSIIKDVSIITLAPDGLMTSNSRRAQHRSILKKDEFLSQHGMTAESLVLKKNNIYLQLDQKGLAIVSPEFKLTYVDELYKKLNERLKKLNQELLIRTVKIKGLSHLQVWDLTAGFGKDAILIANAGHQVTMVEKNPLLAIILNYVILHKIVPGTENLKLIHMDSLNYLLQEQLVPPHVIYLDPMFQDNKSAKAKKDMQIIALLVDVMTDNFVYTADGNERLFTLAYKTALNKVIVKRDNKQETLLKTPFVSYAKPGKTIRYDVYLRAESEPRTCY